MPELAEEPEPEPPKALLVPPKPPLIDELRVPLAALDIPDPPNMLDDCADAEDASKLKPATVRKLTADLRWRCFMTRGTPIATVGFAFISRKHAGAIRDYRSTVCASQLALLARSSLDR